MKSRSLHIAALAACVVFTLSALPSRAEETESPAKALARKRAEEKLRQGGSLSTSSRSDTVNLNTGTRTQLANLPGLTEEDADKIIAGRPYKAKTDLRVKGILSSQKFYNILDKVSLDIVLLPYQPPSAAPPQKKGAEKKSKNLFKDIKMQ